MSEDTERRKESVNGRRIIQNYEPRASVERTLKMTDKQSHKQKRKENIYHESNIEMENGKPPWSRVPCTERTVR